MLDELCERCLAQGPQALSRAEQSLLARDRISLGRMHREVWQLPDDTPWGVALRRRLAAP